MPDPITAIMGGSAILGAGSSIFGASKQAQAADKATDAQVQANRENIALQKDIFEQQKTAIKPWQDVGLEAVKQIRQGIQDGSFDISKYGYADLIKDPGYQFRLSEGNKALQMSAAASGGLISGDQLRAASDYNQAAASQEFNNAFNRTAGERDTRYNILSGMADRGQSATNALLGVQTQLGDRLSTANTNTGNAIAQGAINTGNAWAAGIGGASTAIQQGMGNYLTYNRLQQLGVA